MWSKIGFYKKEKISEEAALQMRKNIQDFLFADILKMKENGSFCKNGAVSEVESVSEVETTGEVEGETAGEVEPTVEVESIFGKSLAFGVEPIFGVSPVSGGEKSVFHKKDENFSDFFYLKKLLNYRFFESGLSFFYFEKYFPDYVGFYESSGFYDCALENASWVEDLILELEEERIANEISILDGAGHFGFDKMNEFETEATEIEEVLSEQNMQKEISDENGNLSFMEFNQERFIPQKTESGYSVIHSINNNVTRKFFDENFRLEKVEKWLIKNSLLSEEQKPVLTTEYFYDENTQKLKKVSETSLETQIDAFYDEKKQVIKKETFALFNEKKFLTLENKISYDENGNIVENQSTQHFYSDDFSKQTDVISKKYVYSLNENGIPPDLKYYENGILKKKDKFSSEKGSYTSQIYFDGGFSVKTYFQNEEKIREVYFSGEDVLRVKNYEK